MGQLIEIKNLSKSFGDKQVIKDLNLEILSGSVVAIIGPSGSGKTTLLRCLNGLCSIDDGQIKIDTIVINNNQELKKEEIRNLRLKVGMVFQQFNLWPHKTVLENITLAPVKVKKINREQAKDSAKVLLDKMGLSELFERYISSLSGGQQQRVAIARALIMEPEILLLDEITSALDPELVGEMLKLLGGIVKELKKTFIIVSHEMGFVREVADVVIFMDNGVIVEVGSPEEIFTKPKEIRTQQFLARLLDNKFYQ